MGESHKKHWDRLKEYTAEILEKNRVPGAVVGILHQGEVATAAFGVTNVDHPLPVTDETLFQIGSITKTFTGTAAMRLVEMGKVDLDATVQTYLPDFKVADEDASRRATVKHLLTHMGGWVGDLFIDTGTGEDAVAAYVSSMADLEQLAPIGTVHSYNNAGFSVAGLIIEKVMGINYDDAMQELVLKPLELKNLYFHAGDVISHRFAVGHTVGENGAEVARPWSLPRGVHPAGGIICDVHTLLRYARFHLGNGLTDKKTGPLMSESIVTMQTPHATVWGKDSWGISWAVNDSYGCRQISHGGGTVGQISLLKLVPEQSFALAVFTNANKGGSITGEINRWALKQYLGIDIADPEPKKAPEKDLIPYVGRYSRPLIDIELGMLGGQLIGRATPKAGFPTEDAPPPPPSPPATMDLCEKDRLVTMDGPAKGSVADVVRKGDGSIGWLRAGGRAHVLHAQE